jgi:hypothetical protein
LKLAFAVHERWPPIKIILVSGKLKLSKTDIPSNSRFFGKPLEATEMMAEIQEHDWQGLNWLQAEQAAINAQFSSVFRRKMRAERDRE